MRFNLLSLAAPSRYLYFAAAWSSSASTDTSVSVNDSSSRSNESSSNDSSSGSSSSSTGVSVNDSSSNNEDSSSEGPDILYELKTAINGLKSRLKRKKKELRAAVDKKLAVLLEKSRLYPSSKIAATLAMPPEKFKRDVRKRYESNGYVKNAVCYRHKVEKHTLEEKRLKSEIKKAQKKYKAKKSHAVETLEASLRKTRKKMEGYKNALKIHAGIAKRYKSILKLPLDKIMGITSALYRSCAAIQKSIDDKKYEYDRLSGRGKRASISRSDSEESTGSNEAEIKLMRKIRGDSAFRSRYMVNGSPRRAGTVGVGYSLADLRAEIRTRLLALKSHRLYSTVLNDRRGNIGGYIPQNLVKYLLNDNNDPRTGGSHRNTMAFIKRIKRSIDSDQLNSNFKQKFIHPLVCMLFLQECLLEYSYTGLCESPPRKRKSVILKNRRVYPALYSVSTSGVFTIRASASFDADFRGFVDMAMSDDDSNFGFSYENWLKSIGTS